jgi:ribose transport system permease protein
VWENSGRSCSRDIGGIGGIGGIGDRWNLPLLDQLPGSREDGGAGSVVGSVVGALLIGLINNGLVLMGLDVSQQLIIHGAIIILAVALGRRNAV